MSGAPAAGTAVERRTLEGHVDCIAPSGVYGWAFDRRFPHRRLSVDMRVNGRIVATLRCNGFRADLRDAGIGDGRTAFWGDVSAHLTETENSVEVLFGGSEVALPNGRAKLPRVEPPPPGDNPWNAPAPVSYDAIWLGAPTVKRAINRKISGDEERGWLEHAMARYLAPALGLAPSPRRREDYRCLLLGANEGSMERTLCAAGFRGRILASDIADRALARARAAAVELGYSNVEHVVADLNRDRFDGPFDWIIAEGVLHHIERIEDCLAGLRHALAPRALLIMVEYIGPRRFQLSDLQTRWIRAALDAMPRELRPLPRDDEGRHPAAADERERILYSPPTEAEMIALDPSEAVIGPRLIAAIEERFEIVERTGFGGTLLSYMTGHFDFARANEDAFADDWLRILMQMEDTLIRHRVLDDEFVFLVARPRETG